MTEDEARERVAALVPRETMPLLDSYVALLLGKASEQNLVAASTLGSVWSRHILDSAQLVAHARAGGTWLDLGSGAGLPGLVIAAVGRWSVLLMEPRAKRCAFLREAAAAMDVRVEIMSSRAEAAPAVRASVISARAVAALPALFAMGQKFARPETLWLLPKGRAAASEVAVASRSWHADIDLVPSITDSEAAIVVATNVYPKGRS